VLVALCAVGAAVAGFGGSSMSNASASLSNNTAAAKLPGASAPLSQAAAAVTAAQAPVASLKPAGGMFNAKKATQGKTIGWVSVSLAIPFTSQMLSGADAAAKTLGLTIHTCDGGSTAAGWAMCYQQFIAQKVNVIVSQSIDPRILTASIAAAGAAGIPVVTSSSNYPGATLWPGTSAEDAQPVRAVGKLIGDYIASNSAGKADVLIITSSEVYIAPGQVNATTAEFQKYCPKTCKSSVVNVPVADWATKISTEVESAITADPNLDYIVPLYDGEVPYAVSGVDAKSAQSRVKIVSFNALPSIMQYIKKHQVLTADVGVWVQQHGYAAIDDVARVLAGQKGTPVLTNPQLAIRMFDTSNVGSLNFNNPSSWYGSASLASFYGKQWKVK